MSNASDKRELELYISHQSSFVPKHCQPAFSTMLRQGLEWKGWLPFYKIHSGCNASSKTGSAIMKLVSLGLASESLIETEHGMKRAWKLKIVESLENERHTASVLH